MKTTSISRRFFIIGLRICCTEPESLRDVLEYVVISFDHSSHARKVSSQDSVTRMGQKSWRTYEMARKPFRTYYFLNQFLEFNFLEKKIQETSEKYFFQTNLRLIFERLISTTNNDETISNIQFRFRIFSIWSSTSRTLSGSVLQMRSPFNMMLSKIRTKTIWYWIFK